MRKDSSVSGIGLAGHRSVRSCRVLGSGFRMAGRDRVQHQSDEVVRVVGPGMEQLEKQAGQAREAA